MNYSHLTQGQIDANYANAQSVANMHLANGNSQAAHEQHKFMQQMVGASQALNRPQPQSSHAPSHAPSPAPYVPPPPPPGQDSVNYTPVKIPDAEVVVFLQDQVSADALEKLYFEDVGGTEILAVARHDTVGGEPVATAPISNLEDIKLQFNPLNILSSINSNELFNQFAIDMNTHIYDTNNAVYGETMWIDDTSYQKYLVVEVDDLKADEYIQIQVAGNTVEYEIYDESWYNGSGGTP